MRDLEKAVFDAAREQLSAFSDKLRDRAVTWVIDHELWESDDSKYTSEIRVTFWRNGDVLDIFEHHIYQDGRLLTTREEANEWFRKELDELIQTFDPAKNHL